MKLHTLMLVAGGLLFSGANSLAAIICSVTSAGFTVAAYVEGVNPGPQQTSFTVSCTRATGDPQSTTWRVSHDTGLNGSNRAAAVVGGTTYNISYTLADGTTCATPWAAGTGGALTGTLTWANNGDRAAKTATRTYAGCIAAQSGMPAATYTDTLGLTVTNSASAGQGTGNAAVSVTSGVSCSMPVAPGTVAFNYPAFSSSVVTAETPFEAKCTNLHSYVLSLSPTTGTLLGLVYSLSVVTSPGNVAVDGPPPVSITGSGANQKYKVLGSMAAGQAGTCASGVCNSAPNPHTLTFTY